MDNMPDQVVNIGGEDNVVEQGGVVAADDGNPAAPQPNGPMHWTPVQSGFMLRRFHDLVGQGVKTEKGFKEVHVRQVALMVSEFAGVNVTTQQIYNHLRKWRQRWVKVVRLKDLSGALWDEDHHMIVLDDEHLLGHTKVRNCLDNTSAIPFLFFCSPMSNSYICFTN